jgi:flagellar basal-body rod protein FlgF/flagellar basal-body rod protein FlgG
MYYGLYMSAAGAHAQSQQVEVLSNNLANADTVGFKRELALLEARDSEAIERGLDHRGSRSANDIGGGIRFSATATDFRSGKFRETGIPTDLALERPGDFFAVQRGNEQLLTRAGNFRLATDGTLLTQENDPVLASDGSPIQIDPALPWRILPGGLIEQAGDALEIGIFRPGDPQSLEKLGQNYFSARGQEPEPVAPEERALRGGFVELSAVNPVEEMVELIAASRNYEANIRLIQQHDQATSQLINRMLRV